MPSKPQTFRLGFESKADSQGHAASGRQWQQLYDWRWTKASKLYLTGNRLCIGCLVMGNVEIATLVDHVRPHRGDRAKFWDQTNWQASCEWHHRVIKTRLEAAFDQDRCEAPDLRLDSTHAHALAARLRVEV